MPLFIIEVVTGAATSELKSELTGTSWGREEDREEGKDGVARGSKFPGADTVTRGEF